MRQHPTRHKDTHLIAPILPLSINSSTDTLMSWGKSLAYRVLLLTLSLNQLTACSVQPSPSNGLTWHEPRHRPIQSTWLCPMIFFFFVYYNTTNTNKNYHNYYLYLHLPGPPVRPVQGRRPPLCSVPAGPLERGELHLRNQLSAPQPQYSWCFQSRN